MFGLSKGPTGVFKSVLDTQRTDGKRRDEIYVDVVERLTATFNATGHISASQIDGSIQVDGLALLARCMAQHLTASLTDAEVTQSMFNGRVVCRPA